jgi:hypothetical protein
LSCRCLEKFSLIRLRIARKPPPSTNALIPSTTLLPRIAMNIVAYRLLVLKSQLNSNRFNPDTPPTRPRNAREALLYWMMLFLELPYPSSPLYTVLQYLGLVLLGQCLPTHYWIACESNPYRIHPVYRSDVRRRVLSACGMT